MNEQDEIMQRITAALEAKPPINAPADFSSRMAARLSRKPARRILPILSRRSQYGRFATHMALALLLAAMLGIPLLGRQSGTWSFVQTALFTQFCALMLWLVLSRRRVF